MPLKSILAIYAYSYIAKLESALYGRSVPIACGTTSSVVN